MKLNYIFFIVFMLLGGSMTAQFVHFGYTMGIDLYQHIRTPESNVLMNERYSTGSAILNLNAGPKIWFGNGNMTVSLEGQVSYAPLAFDLSKYRGLGAISFPFMASLNFKGLSTTSRNFGFGWSISGGMQYINTDLYFLSDEYGAIPREGRPQYFPVYFGQISVGTGAMGVSAKFYIRWGMGPHQAGIFSSGLVADINGSAIRGIKDIPKSIQ